MKETNLRIGSLIYYNGGAPDDIDSLEPVDLEDFKWMCDNKVEFFKLHKPIPLSERWFVDFQFESMQEGWYAKDKAFPTSEYWDFTWNVYDKEFRYKGYVIKVNYVHELQNLYLAITGNELILRENFGR